MPFNPWIRNISPLAWCLGISAAYNAIPASAATVEPRNKKTMCLILLSATLTATNAFAQNNISDERRKQSLANIRALNADPAVKSALDAAFKCSISGMILYLKNTNESAETLAKAAYTSCFPEWRRHAAIAGSLAPKYSVPISEDDIEKIQRVRTIEGMTAKIIDIRSRAAQ